MGSLLEELILFDSYLITAVFALLFIWALLTIRYLRRVVTTRNSAERLLHISESRLRTAMEATETGLWEWNPQSNEVYLNPVWFTMLGYAADSMPAAFTTFEALLHPDDRAATLATIQTLLAGQRDWFESDFRMRSHNGSYRWIHSKGKVLETDSAGHAKRLIGIHIDVTESKLNEQALQTSEERFRRLMAQSPISIQIHALDGKLVESNAAYAKLFGLNEKTLQELYKKYNVLRDEQAKQLGLMPCIQQVYEGEDVIFPAYEYNGIDTLKTLNIRNPVSKQCWIQTLGFPLKDSQGNITSAVFLSVDITESKRAEQRLSDYQSRLKRLTAELMHTEEHERRLIAADLHDNVGQSLALTRLQITTAQRDLPAEHPLMTSLADISQTLLRTIQYTRHLIFELSSPTLNELGLGPAIAEWTEQQAASWPELKVEVIDHAKPLDLDADLRAMLFRNVRELITNVIKHAQANCLSIWLDRGDDELVITIQDDGVGFDPARVLHDVRPEGGYGLFSIQERMTNLSGSLTLVSQPGAGCKAILRLPLNVDTMPA